MSEANDDDFLILEEEKVDSQTLVNIVIPKEKNNEKNNHINQKLISNDYSNLSHDDLIYDAEKIFSILSKFSFTLFLFGCLSSIIITYDCVYGNSCSSQIIDMYDFYILYSIYMFLLLVLLPATIILNVISFIIKTKNNDLEENISSDKINFENIDASLSSSLGGVWKVGWEVYGIDCPDCAVKISKALNSMRGVTNTNVSITTALVTFEIDLEIGKISTVNSILCDLGYAPNAKWWEIMDASAEKIQDRLGISETQFLNRLSIQPGVLESHIENDQVFIRLATQIDENLTKEFKNSINHIIGNNSTLRPKGGEWGLRPDQKQLLGGLIGLLFLPVILIIQSIQTGGINDIWYFMQYLIGLPAIIIGSKQLLKKAFEGIKRYQLNFEILVSMAILGAILLQAWFEALLIIVLVAFANNLENSAIRKARDSMQGGLNRIPNDARLIKNNTMDAKNIVKIKSLIMTSDTDNTLEKKNTEMVPIGLLNIKDHVEIRTGEIIPVDGVIISGQGLVDKSALTGESLPHKLVKGDFIEAGLVLTRGPIIVETLETGSNTRLSELITTTKQYQEAPTRLHTVLELFTKVWVPLVLFGSVFVAIMIPDSFISEGGSRFKIVLLLWVTACPCALLICAPIPHAISISLASSKGIVAKGGDVLEKIAKVNLALLDKTGTLTEGRPQITTIIPTKGSKMKTIIGISAGLELSSNHPYASAIIDRSESEKISPYKIQNLTDDEGGVSGTYNGEEVAIGNVEWMEKQGYNIPNELFMKINEIEATGISILAKGRNAIAVFGFASDALNPNSSKLISNLNKQNIKVELLSGDNQESVNKTAKDLGIPVEICRGGLTPEQKVEWVAQRSITHVTLMAGDGFNDAAAMAKADVGVSVGNKEQLNLDAADVMIPSERPDLISSLCGLSQKTRNVVIQNLILSITLTSILVFSVIFGKNEQIWLNVLAHEFSVILVIINAMKLSVFSFTGDLVDSNETNLIKYKPFTLIANLFKELYEDSKEVIQARFG